MAITLADLVTRLQEDVPARDGAPTAEQYARAATEAIADYSARCPMQRITTLSIAAGVASYTLPADFLSLVRLDTTSSKGGVLHTSAGLIPAPTSWTERYTVNGLTLTFTPTPTYTLDRLLIYAARHVLDAQNSYPDLTDRDVGILILKAQALALRAQAVAILTSATGEIVEYQVGDEKVKKVGASEGLRTAAAFLEREYLEAVKAALGTTGSRARYDVHGALR